MIVFVRLVGNVQIMISSIHFSVIFLETIFDEVNRIVHSIQAAGKLKRSLQMTAASLVYVNDESGQFRAIRPCNFLATSTSYPAHLTTAQSSF